MQTLNNKKEIEISQYKMKGFVPLSIEFFLFFLNDPLCPRSHAEQPIYTLPNHNHNNITLWNEIYNNTQRRFVFSILRGIITSSYGT